MLREICTVQKTMKKRTKGFGLYCRAKQKPSFFFFLRWDSICRITELSTVLTRMIKWSRLVYNHDQWVRLSCDYIVVIMERNKVGKKYLKVSSNLKVLGKIFIVKSESTSKRPRDSCGWRHVSRTHLFRGCPLAPQIEATILIFTTFLVSLCRQWVPPPTVKMR